jgi:hypothetical protein
MHHSDRVVAATLLTVCASCALPESALAIPAFSRKYETSCMTCHVAPPKLNPFGRAFKNRGYTMTDDDAALVKQPQVSVGAPGWKKLWPNAFWPSDIPGGNYFAVSFKSSFRVNPSAPVTNEFDGLGDVALLMAGTLGETLSFFGDFELAANGESGGVERAFLQYHHPTHLLNVTVGDLQPRAQPFIGPLSATGADDYLADVFPMTTTTNYFGFVPHQKGIEVWGAREGSHGSGGALWAVGIVNGDAGEAAEVLEDVPGLAGPLQDLKSQMREQGGRYDVNSSKDVYVQASYQIGGRGVLGSGSGPVSSRNWRDKSITIGGYLYRGTTAAILNSPGTAAPAFDAGGNTFYRSGATFDWWFNDLNVFGGWQRNRDTLRDGRRADATIVTGEADYVTPWPWIQPAVRLEIVTPDFGGGRFSRTLLSATVVVRANVLLTLQGFASTHEAPPWPWFDDQFRAAVRLVF